MAIVPKDKLLQIRIDNDLLERFSAIADVHHVSVSGLLRSVMGRYVDHFEQRIRKDAEWAATQASRASAAAGVDLVEKQTVGPLRQPESLAERIKAERAAKKAKKLKRDERF
jgi:antitoxin component of RelBE/YafQ-DinJ toxin-antitoxin module